MKTTLIIASLLIACAAAAVWYYATPTPRPPGIARAKPPPPEQPRPASAAPHETPRPAAPPPAPQADTPAENAAPAAEPAPEISLNEKIKLARTSLKFVGADDAATEYWLDAIGNPDLPPKDRADLMEDLNEEGFANLQNPGPDDVQLIRTRLDIIDAALPTADKFMQKHLGEARKDLQKMLQRATPPE